MLSVPIVVHSIIPSFHAESVKPVKVKPILTLAQTWNDFIYWKIY